MRAHKQTHAPYAIIINRFFLALFSVYGRWDQFRFNTFMFMITDAYSLKLSFELYTLAFSEWIKKR